ncbi:MAG: hypothetical protein BMS9Abin23_0532 [Thermodesulfobacteriota bacterium]|nr:MAG: hypothetical protein BMS9Abin23_0532 [Thermodesulfobacteriota bacterium]
MARIIKKEIGRIYRCIISVTAVCLFRVKECGQTAAADVTIDSGNEGVTLRKAARCGRHRNSGARNIIVRVLGSFPCLMQPVDPSLYISFPSRTAVKKEYSLDLEDKSISSKPASLSSKNRVEWFKKSGLERPRRTFSLARDDLDAAVTSFL